MLTIGGTECGIYVNSVLALQIFCKCKAILKLEVYLKSILWALL